MGVPKNTLSHRQPFYKLENKKHWKVTYLNWKGKTKEHTEEAL